MNRWLIYLLLSLSSMQANAFVDAPYITPPRPTPTQTISVQVNAGWCHAPTDDVNQAELVHVSPGKLQLIADGVVLPEGHPFCIHPPFTYRFEIGTLPAGRYSLQFVMRDDIGGSGLVEFGTVEFVVTPPARVPATSAWAIALCVALIAACVAGSRARPHKLFCSQ